jgi:tetratricopeptide (TPR) repeat protein
MKKIILAVFVVFISSLSFAAGKQIKIDPEVIKAIEQRSETDPKAVLRVYYIAAEACQAMKEPDRALAVLDKAAGLFPGEADIFVRKLSLYQQKKDYDKALETLKALSRLQPDNAYYAQAAANAYFAKGDAEKASAAIADFAKAHPNDANAQFQCAQFLQGRGKTNEALKYLEASYKLKPDDPLMVTQLSQAYIMDKKLDEAKSICEKALPQAREPWARRAIQMQLLAIARENGALDTAIEDIKKNLARNPSDINNHKELIDAYMTAGRTEEAARTAEAAIKRFPDDTELIAIEKAFGEQMKARQQAAPPPAPVKGEAAKGRK